MFGDLEEPPAAGGVGEDAGALEQPAARRCDGGLGAWVVRRAQRFGTGEQNERLALLDATELVDQRDRPLGLLACRGRVPARERDARERGQCGRSQRRCDLEQLDRAPSFDERRVELASREQDLGEVAARVALGATVAETLVFFNLSSWDIFSV